LVPSQNDLYCKQGLTSTSFWNPTGLYIGTCAILGSHPKEENFMTVLELKTTHHPESTVLNPSPQIQSPQISKLSVANQGQGQSLLLKLEMALKNGDVEVFNQAKKQIFSFLKQSGEAITPWSLLTLEFFDPNFLKDSQLAHIDLSLLRLVSQEKPLSLAGSQLQTANLKNGDFSGTDFHGADLTGANLQDCDLREANLEYATLIEADLSAAKLSFSTCNYANFYGARLNGLLARQASFFNADLRKTQLQQADLYQCNLQEARLQQADLRKASLFLADLSDSRLRQANLEKANLSSSCLRNARLQEANLTDTELIKADLSMADLKRCRIKSTKFDRAHLYHTHLNCIDLSGIDLSSTENLKSAIIRNVRYDNKTIFPENFDIKAHGFIARRCQGFLHQLLHTFLPHRCCSKK
jgi:uncharacterized protein YjbI with pentapeptide repeats